MPFTIWHSLIFAASPQMTYLQSFPPCQAIKSLKVMTTSAYSLKDICLIFATQPDRTASHSSLEGSFLLSSLCAWLQSPGSCGKNLATMMKEIEHRMAKRFPRIQCPQICSPPRYNQYCFHRKETSGGFCYFKSTRFDSWADIPATMKQEMKESARQISDGFQFSKRCLSGYHLYEQVAYLSAVKQWQALTDFQRQQWTIRGREWCKRQIHQT